MWFLWFLFWLLQKSLFTTKTIDDTVKCFQVYYGRKD